MEKKRLSLIIISLLLISTIFAQPVTVKISDVKIVEEGQTFYLHSVSPGQTLFSISRAYEVDQAEIMKHNPNLSTVLQAGLTLRIPDKSVPGKPRTTTAQPNDTVRSFLQHTVAPGETLFGIARLHNVSVQQVINANPDITNFDNLQIGQAIKIPVRKISSYPLSVLEIETDSVCIHQVQRGESLFGIAQKYKVGQDSLITWNPELKDNPLRRGQDLRIIYKVKIIQPKPTVTPIETAKIKYDTILHQIQEKETIWGLAKRYNTTVDQIVELNPELKEGLKKGYYIYIPVPVTSEKIQETVTAKSKGCENSRYKAKYKIALLIPLYLDEIDRIYITPGTDEQIRKPFFKPFSFLEFYEGVLIAIDSMKRAGLSIDMHVYDTGNDSITLKRILAKPEMPYMDLIIGPFFMQNYSIAAQFAARHNIKIVSPFARNPQLIASHGNLFQLNASSESKLAELARHIARSYQDPNVILVMSNTETDKALAKAFNLSFELHTAAQARKPNYIEVIYSDRGAAGVSTRLDVGRQNIIVNLITGETTVSNYVSAMANLTKNFRITMYGMPEWRDYRTFDLVDLMALDMHLFSNAFVDYENPATIAFLNEFRSRYKGEPEENYYGYIGYDVALYFLKAIHEYGLDFENCLGEMNYNPIGTGFLWEQVKGKGYENIYLNIFRFNDFRLEPVKQKR